MEQMFNTLVSAIPETALPVVVVVIACFYIYRKIKSERKETKTERDKDSQEIHDKLMKHDFEIANIKGMINLHGNKLEQIERELNCMNSQLSELNGKITILISTIKEKL